VAEAKAIAEQAEAKGEQWFNAKIDV
jgi:hypothetical protein